MTFYLIKIVDWFDEEPLKPRDQIYDTPDVYFSTLEEAKKVGLEWAKSTFNDYHQSDEELPGTEWPFPEVEWEEREDGWWLKGKSSDFGVQYDPADENAGFWLRIYKIEPYSIRATYQEIQTEIANELEADKLGGRDPIG